LNLETFFGHLLNAEQDAVAVQRAEGNSLEDQQVESALEKVELFLHGRISEINLS
jgi:hypothetical protein